MVVSYTMVAPYSLFQGSSISLVLWQPLSPSPVVAHWSLYYGSPLSLILWQPLIPCSLSYGSSLFLVLYQPLVPCPKAMSVYYISPVSNRTSTINNKLQVGNYLLASLKSGRTLPKVLSVYYTSPVSNYVRPILVSRLH